VTPSFEAYLNLVHPKKESLLRKSPICFTGKKGYILDHQFVFPDGTRGILHVTLDTIVDDNGKLCRLVGTTQDITGQKQTEAALQHSRDYLDRIINTVADPIFVKDRQHRWALVNDAMCRLIGIDRERLLFQSDYEFFPKAEADIFWEKDEQVFLTGKKMLMKSRSQIRQDSCTPLLPERHYMWIKKV
jgi:PAS domain-containing protein